MRARLTHGRHMSFAHESSPMTDHLTGDAAFLNPFTRVVRVDRPLDHLKLGVVVFRHVAQRREVAHVPVEQDDGRRPRARRSPVPQGCR